MIYNKSEDWRHKTSPHIKKLWELLMLESFQAGLSWECILNKREGFRKAFDDFDVEKISRYGEEKYLQLLADPNIIRNKLKIKACITNSKIFRKIQEEYGSFDTYIWGFTERPYSSFLKYINFSVFK